MASPKIPIKIFADELEIFESKRLQLQALQKQVKQLEAELKAETDGIMSRLKAGAKEPKGWVLAIEEKMGQVRPAWKEAFQALCLRCGLNPGHETAKVIEAFQPEVKENLVVVRK